MVRCGYHLSNGGVCKRAAGVGHKYCFQHETDPSPSGSPERKKVRFGVTSSQLKDARLNAFSALKDVLGVSKIRNRLITGGVKEYEKFCMELYELLPGIDKADYTMWFKNSLNDDGQIREDWKPWCPKFAKWMNKLVTKPFGLGTLVDGKLEFDEDGNPSHNAHFISVVYEKPSNVLYLYDPASPCGPGYYTADGTIRAINTYCEKRGIRVMPLVGERACQLHKNDTYCQTWSLRFLEITLALTKAGIRPKFPFDFENSSKSEAYILRAMQEYAMRVRGELAIEYAELSAEVGATVEMTKLDPLELILTSTKLP